MRYSSVLKTTGITCFMLMVLHSVLFAQDKVTTVGLQFKPIIPLKLLNTGTEVYNNNNVNFTVDPQLGYSVGMIIRSGLTKTISVESGINFIARNYNMKVFDNNKDAEITTRMRFDGYEIPVVVLVFIQLGRKMYMNSAFGCSFDFYPTGGIVDNQSGYEFGILESQWVQAALLTNLGFEYRTDKSGYLYFGASFHRPFTKTADIFLSERIPSSNKFNRLIESELLGNYLTLDLRYFFAENPKRKGKR
jgi:hypothetical protein